jgi:hypothetical protein
MYDPLKEKITVALKTNTDLTSTQRANLNEALEARNQATGAMLTMNNNNPARSGSPHGFDNIVELTKQREVVAKAKIS